MALNPNVMQAVERLDYRVTAGDVAAQIGLDVRQAEQDLLALATDAGGHLQVAESGEIAYQFPQNFRGVLRNKYWQLRFQETRQRVWNVLSYLIRISFGIVLLVSIVLVVVAIIILITAASSAQKDERSSNSSGGLLLLPRLWLSPNWFYVFSPNYHRRRVPSQRYTPRGAKASSEMNFLEAVFSVLFGDGDPNADLEERRWQAIATVIRNHKGSVIAEQIAPYLDDLGSGYSREYEDYMLPVLTRFNGRPEVSPEGGLIYHFPALQVSAERQGVSSVSAYLKEVSRQFSSATSNQVGWAIGLGVFNLVGVVFLGGLLSQGVPLQSSFIALISAIYGFLLVYALGFLVIPVGRYFWLRWQNRQIAERNERRQARAIALNQADESIQAKLAYAQQFAAETVVSPEDLIYTTERDLLEQEVEQRDRLDAEWRDRLDRSSNS